LSIVQEQPMSTNAPPIIRLHHSDGGEQIEVVTNKNDVIYLTVEAAIKACKDQVEREDFTQQFDDLLDKLREWIELQKQDIAEAYVTLRDTGLLFLVVSKTRRFNQALEDALTELDVFVAQSEGFNLIQLSVLALPAADRDSIDSFLGASKLKYAK